MGGLGRSREVLKQDSVNDLIVGEWDEVPLREVFPGIVEKIKLRKANYTGDKKEIKAFFNMFGKEPQVTFKYGKEYCVFKLDVASVEEVAYNLEHNFK